VYRAQAARPIATTEAGTGRQSSAAAANGLGYGFTRSAHLHAQTALPARLCNYTEKDASEWRPRHVSEAVRGREAVHGCRWIVTA